MLSVVEHQHPLTSGERTDDMRTPDLPPSGGYSDQPQGTVCPPVSTGAAASLICFHYKNLRPMWAKDNMSKGSTIEDGFGSSWSITCPVCGNDSMHIVRPGKVQCENCD